jgi:hypothetical protein
VRVLSRLFRRLFLDALQAAFARGDLACHGPLAPLADPAAFRRLLAAAHTTAWEVYAQPPCGGPAQVLDYLGRSTPRVALAYHRLLALEDGHVTFRLKDYRQGNRLTTMTLDAQEFIRRFLLHVLPDGFMRLRHFGFLSHRPRVAQLARCRALLGVPDPRERAPPAPPDWRTRYAALTGAPVDRSAELATKPLPRLSPGPAAPGRHPAAPRGPPRARPSRDRLLLSPTSPAPLPALSGLPVSGPGRGPSRLLPGQVVAARSPRPAPARAPKALPQAPTWQSLPPRGPLPPAPRPAIQSP